MSVRGMCQRKICEARTNRRRRVLITPWAPHYSKGVDSPLPSFWAALLGGEPRLPGGEPGSPGVEPHCKSEGARFSLFRAVSLCRICSPLLPRPQMGESVLLKAACTLGFERAFLLRSREAPRTLGGRVDADAAVSANPEPPAARHEREEALDGV